MEEFIRSYGIWILLAGVFFAMHWFGMGCGGHGHGGERRNQPDAGGETKKQPAHSGHRGGCH